MSELIYKTKDDLTKVIEMINEALKFLDNPEKQYKEQSKDFEQMLGFFGGAGAGAAAGFAALYAAGITGLSAAGIASGLAAIGGSMLGGIAALAAAPIAIGAAGYLAVKWFTSESLSDVVKRLLDSCNNALDDLDEKQGTYQSQHLEDQCEKFINALKSIKKDLRSDLKVHKKS